MRTRTHSGSRPDLATVSLAMRGFSLIEMMISMVIGLLVVVALIGVLVNSKSGSKTNDRTSELQSNGRYALNSLRFELRHAGFRGYTWAEPNVTSTSVTGECIGTGFITNLRQGVWGANDSNPFAATCLPATAYAGDDILVLRRLGVTAATSTAGDLIDNGLHTGANTYTGATYTANSIFFRSTYNAGEPFKGTAYPAISGSPLVDYPVQVYVYYISPYTASATENPRVPALYRIALQADGTFTPELVATGIEKLQIQYGRATTDLNTRYYDASGITGTTTDTLPTEWDDVNSVRIWMLARNTTTEPGYVNNTSYVMGDQTYTVNDGYRRQLFTTVVQLRK